MIGEYWLILFLTIDKKMYCFDASSKQCSTLTFTITLIMTFWKRDWLSFLVTNTIQYIYTYINYENVKPVALVHELSVL